MAISIDEFNRAYAAKQGSLPARIQSELERAGQALTAREVTARLLGITGRYLPILSQEVSAALPMVQEVLTRLEAQGLLREQRMQGAVGELETYYCGPVKTAE